MTNYDDLFDDVATTDSVFADKGALDPLADPDEVIARQEEERVLASILAGVHEGYLPTTVAVYGPPGTGKTLTTRRLCGEFAARTPEFGFEYVNLKECRSQFSVANEILFELTGERKQAYEGLDGVFAGIWDAFEEYPEHVVLILDEIDHITQDGNYDPNDFFYRLLRGEGKVSRGLNLSVFIVSNELLEVDLRLDSRVQSAMSGEEVFFAPYDFDQLRSILGPRLARAFRDGALPDEVQEYGIRQAASRWGDVRKTLTLFRHAGETANERELEQVTADCIDRNMDATEKTATIEKLNRLPTTHLGVLVAITGRSARQTGEIVQPVTTQQVHETLHRNGVRDRFQLGERAIRDVVRDLETMGLVETWVKSKGRAGRAKQIETAFDPQWVREAQRQYLDERVLLSDESDG